ncbi:MAG TPA: hypothetical protein VF476_13785, partial [Chitinophagaceae bacterium]
MKKEIKNPEAIIVLVVSTNEGANPSIKLELSSYVVNRCHKKKQQKAVDTFITSHADHFLFHMPFSC